MRIRRWWNHGDLGPAEVGSVCICPRGRLYGSLSSPGLVGTSAAQLEGGQLAVPRGRTSPCVPACCRCLGVRLTWPQPPCPAPWAAVRAPCFLVACAQLWYQIAGIPEEVPLLCVSAQKPRQPPAHVPVKCPLPKPSPCRPCCGSYEVPFLEPSEATALPGARSFRGSGLVWVL